MRVFIAGATGVIGTRLVPLLRSEGHQVTGMTRSPAKTALLNSLGADPVVCDVYNLKALRETLKLARAEVIIDELTDLPDDQARIQEFRDANDRIRREGTSNIIVAAGEAGVSRVLAQSVAWELPGEGGKAILDLERMILDTGGVVLRYGQFYGPGTYHVTELPPPPRVNIDKAARRTVPALGAPTGIITVTD